MSPIRMIGDRRSAFGDLSVFDGDHGDLVATATLYIVGDRLDKWQTNAPPLSRFISLFMTLIIILE